MKTFKIIVVVKHPPALVWATIRDRLAEVVPLLDDIEKITVVERKEEMDGTVRLVSLWKANPKIPAMLASVVKPSMLAWIDRAEWNPRVYECKWRVEPQFFPERTRCSGITKYETAMGGKGTRITFEGSLDVASHNLAGVPSFLENSISSGIEAFVTTVIPKNFRKITEALGTFLGRIT